MKPKFLIILTSAAMAAGAIANAAAAPTVWKLDSTARRLLEVAPENRQADAMVDVRREQLEQAGRWPNPSIDLRADNRIGYMSGKGGTGLSQLAISQPLPIRRLARQRAAAESSLGAARELRRAERLKLERDAARVFLALQYAAARLTLAQERLQVTDAYVGHGHGAGSDALKRYHSPLEHQRLAMLRNDAQQSVILAQRDYDNARIEFQNMLSLPVGTIPEVISPANPAILPRVEELDRGLANHPVIAAARYDARAAHEGIEVAESRRYADPTLKFFRDRDYLNSTFNVTGIGISVEVPLWNQNRSLEGRARAEANASEARLAILERDMRTRLAQAYARLIRQQEQLLQIRMRLLEPASKVLKLTRRSFASGEASVFSLVDANNAYFDVRARQLDLMLGCALAEADLRLAAGISVTDRQEGKQ